MFLRLKTDVFELENRCFCAWNVTESVQSFENYILKRLDGCSIRCPRFVKHMILLEKRRGWSRNSHSTIDLFMDSNPSKFSTHQTANNRKLEIIISGGSAKIQRSMNLAAERQRDGCCRSSEWNGWNLSIAALLNGKSRFREPKSPESSCNWKVSSRMTFSSSYGHFGIGHLRYLSRLQLWQIFNETPPPRYEPWNRNSHLAGPSTLLYPRADWKTLHHAERLKLMVRFAL